MILYIGYINYESFINLKEDKEKGVFPFRFLYDENGNILNIVILAAFFRSPNDNKRYNEYLEAGVKIIGVTSYKTFPKLISDNTGDNETMKDTFEYAKNIKIWIQCFDNPKLYGLTDYNKLYTMSESDFYNVDNSEPVEKVYDIIYSCLDTEDNCSKDGWNYVNRNFKLALECFPIMINEFNLKILVMGRTDCGLEEKFGPNIQTMKMLPYHEFQQKIKESKILFVPNIYDASPRVVAEAITKDVPVLMNRSIVCGSKYINDETGMLFTDEHDIRYSLKILLSRLGTISPKKWWSENYSRKGSAIKLRNFLYEEFPEELKDVKEVYF